jgi:osmotically-inducible protein OsmY
MGRIDPTTQTVVEAQGSLRYLAARIQEALAQDPRVGELGINVDVSASEIRLTGVVSTPERHEAVPEVVHEIAEGYRVINATSVIDAVPNTEAEVLP